MLHTWMGSSQRLKVFLIAGRGTLVGGSRLQATASYLILPIIDACRCARAVCGDGILLVKRPSTSHQSLSAIDSAGANFVPLILLRVPRLLQTAIYPFSLPCSQRSAYVYTAFQYRRSREA